jgi:trimethylamine--corrinoid protein Co-methyltransferase
MIECPRVGAGGHYLSESHTLRFTKAERWFPTLLDRQTRDAWVKNGSRDLHQRPGKKTKEIVDSHVPAKLPSDIERELDKTLLQIEKKILRDNVRKQ